jgi:hypothetical protein
MPVKQIILLYASPENSENALQVCMKIAKKERARVHVVELRHRAATPQFQYPFSNDLTLTQAPVYEGMIIPEDPGTTNQALKYFSQRFSAAGISFTHSSDDIFLDQIIEQTIYADLLIADAHLNIGEYLTAPIDATLQKLRSRAQCPFYLANDRGTEIEKIVLAYDGKATSMQAIKQFTYLFPDASELPVAVVSILESGQESLEQEALLKRWLDEHFSSATIHVLHGKITESLLEFAAAQQENILFVMGNHSSDLITSLFHKSTGPEVLKQIHRAVFT